MTPGLDLHLGEDALDRLADAVADRVADRLGAGTVALNLRQAAVACGVSTKTLLRAISAGELQASRVGNRWVLLRADLETWLTAHRAGTRAGSLRVLYAEGRKDKRPRDGGTSGGMAHRR
jgi:excisionase family DNA binding protein